MSGTLPSEPGTDGQFVNCPTNQSVLGNCTSLGSLSLLSCKTDSPLLQLLNVIGTLQHHKTEMAAALGPALQVSTTSARTHTPPMRLCSTATQMESPMESLLHPGLHQYLGSLGSLCLVWSLHSLSSYDRLVPSSLPVTA